MIFQNCILCTSTGRTARGGETSATMQHIDQSLSLSQQVIQDAQGGEEEAQQRIIELEEQSRSLQKQVSNVSPHMYSVCR